MLDCDAIDAPENCYGNCVWSNNDCVNRTCIHLFSRTECLGSADSCVWSGSEDEFSGVCSAMDLGGDCSAYNDITCPRPRCRLEQSDMDENIQVCTESTCTTFFQEDTCNAAPEVLNCEWKFDQFCLGKSATGRGKEGGPWPCHAGLASMACHGAPLSHRRPLCRYIGPDDQVECNTVYDGTTCQEIDGCDWVAVGGSSFCLPEGGKRLAWKTWGVGERKGSANKGLPQSSRAAR